MRSDNSALLLFNADLKWYIFSYYDD
jgi:hypothetical protein